MAWESTPSIHKLSLNLEEIGSIIERLRVLKILIEKSARLFCVAYISPILIVEKAYFNFISHYI